MLSEKCFTTDDARLINFHGPKQDFHPDLRLASFSYFIDELINFFSSLEI